MSVSPSTRRVIGALFSVVIAADLTACASSGSTAKSAADASYPQVTLPPSPSVPTANAPAARTPRAAATSSPKASAGTALATLNRLRVAGRGPKTGYLRDEFGAAWADVNHNGCDTRNDILKRDLNSKVYKPGTGDCAVLAGTLPDPYTATAIRFVRSGPSEVDIDHVVALGNSWVTGAASWAYAKRVAFANDPLNLLAVDSAANRQKGDGDAATWLPANKSFRCQYIARQIGVKAKYGLHVTPTERAAMQRVLATCPQQTVPTGTSPTVANVTRPSAPKSSPAKAPAASGGGLDPRFATCGAAIHAGYGPYYRGKDPEYAWYIDRDHDGVACE